MIPIVAIGGIVIMEVVALLQGINGVLLGASIAAVAGVGGYKVKTATVGKVLRKVGLNGKRSG